MRSGLAHCLEGMSSSKCSRLCFKVALSMQAGDATVSVASAASRTIMAESYLPPNPGPYPQDKPPENKVRFTPVQVGTPKNWPSSGDWLHVL